MPRHTVYARTLLTAALCASLGAALTAAPAHAEGRPTAYQLSGDAASPVGSKFEGIGADERRGLFYVSEVTGGEIHRGSALTADTQEWLAGDGTDGRCKRGSDGGARRGMW